MHHNTHEAESSNSPDIHMNHDVKLSDYLQFGLIIVLIVIVSIFVTVFTQGGVLEDYMRNFMGVFFITFALFKITNLNGFVSAYSRYDILAARFKPYAYIYPFIELTFGILYVFNLFPIFTNISVILVMAISLIGVVNVLRKGDMIMCACLGNIIKLPVSKITLTEDLTMGIMAVFMLIMVFSV